MSLNNISYPVSARLQLPVTPYAVGEGYVFKQRIPSRGWRITHLGDDVMVPAGTSISAIGDGTVVQVEMRRGSREKRNWGGLVLIQHERKTKNEKRKTFYSLYGHIKNLTVSPGDRVIGGQVVGVVAEGLTPENGWWKEPHLHFAIYVGPWSEGRVLPGYRRWWEWRRTRTAWWRDPQTFIASYSPAT